MSDIHCRFCQTILKHTFIDLGTSPLSNSYLDANDLNKGEIFYPLHTRICHNCFLVQLPQFETPQKIFNDYAYFSSYSDSMLQHVSNYADMMVKRFAIDNKWNVIEIASNDGYLLQYFKAKNIPVLGIEPAANVAEVARSKDIPTESFFFGKKTAEQMLADGKKGDLIIANNVLAHVPELNDFIIGFKTLLSSHGIITIEFPHLLSLIKENQFDTIYHEHFSYFSLLTAQRIFSHHDLSIFDVEEITTHGGSLRIFVKHSQDNTKKINNNVQKILNEEIDFGLNSIGAYQDFSKKIIDLKQKLLEFVLQIKKSGQKIAAYGAPAKGNTLLNFYGIQPDLISFTVDRSPHKQGKYLPGSRIPIYHPDKVKEEKPDYLLILAWNLKEEIMKQMEHVKEWGGKFLIPIPELAIKN